ncbi:MAG: hypothetical protein RLZZ292_86 [Bacteroidota bacterium]|jgi:hypothetical protein
MAYSQFNYKRVKNELGIHNKYKLLFENANVIEPSEWLKESLKTAGRISLYSEKARSEGIVFPILIEIAKHNNYMISVYSGPILNADEKRGLNGECDFILSRGEQDFDLDTPLFCMIEAEDNDIEKNIPQCIAQMEGAKVYNQNEGRDLPCIYGCVTTGTEWQLLQLDGSTCWIDTKRYYINQLPELLGVLQAIVSAYN